jgi:heme iron utilization protein
MATEGLGFEARRLIRGAAAATLATSAAGQPFASLVTPAAAPDLSPLLLLSSLSEHTRHLRTEPRCALLFTGRAESANPQTAPRVTLSGLADFGDFALWWVRPGGALLVGGFARATRLKLAELLPDPASVAALAATEAEILDHVNADHADAVAAIAEGLLGAGPGAWRLVAADTDGCDLAADDRVLRLDWPAPVADADGVRAGLIRAARDGRAALQQTKSNK